MYSAIGLVAVGWWVGGLRVPVPVLTRRCANRSATTCCSTSALVWVGDERGREDLRCGVGIR